MSARPLRFLGIAVLLMSAPIARAEVTRELHGQLAVAAGREFAVENLLGTMQVVAGPGPDVVVTATVYAANAELASGVRLEEVRGERGVPTLRVRYPATRQTLRYDDPDDHGPRLPGILTFGDSESCRYDGRTYRVSSRRGISTGQQSPESQTRASNTRQLDEVPPAQLRCGAATPSEIWLVCT